MPDALPLTPMRLSPSHIQAIKSVVAAAFGRGAEVLLFGSRLDDSARGGDVDLLVTLETTPPDTAFAASLLAAKVARALGGRQVDVVIRTPDSPPQPIHEIAERTGVRL